MFLSVIHLPESFDLLGRVVLGDSLGALRDGMLGELTREDETDSRLDLAGRHRGLGVVAGEAARLGGEALKDVLDEVVHDDHGLLGDTGVGVHLLEDLVDVRSVRVTLALGAAGGRLLATGLLGGGLLGGGL